MRKEQYFVARSAKREMLTRDTVFTSIYGTIYGCRQCEQFLVVNQLTLDVAAFRQALEGRDTPCCDPGDLFLFSEIVANSG